MKNKKLITVIILAVFTVSSLASCGNTEDSSIIEAPQVTETTTVTTPAPASSTTKPTETSTSTTTTTTTTSATTTTKETTEETTTTTKEPETQTKQTTPATTTTSATTQATTTTTQKATTTTTTTTTTAAPKKIVPGHYGASGVYWKSLDETIASWPAGWDGPGFNYGWTQKAVRGFYDSNNNYKKFDNLLDFVYDRYGDPHNEEFFISVGKNLKHDGTDRGKARAVWEAMMGCGFVNCIYQSSICYALCEGVGLECAMSSSLDNGSYGNNNQDFFNSHVQTVVYVDGAWYVLDPSFYMFYFVLFGNDDYAKATGSSVKRCIDKYENQVNITVSNVSIDEEDYLECLI